MSDYRPPLERACGRFPAPELPLEGVFRRRDRRRRNQRIVAGLVALAIAIVGATVVRDAMRTAETPAYHALHRRGALRTAIFGVDGSLEREIYGLPADAFGTQLSPDGRSVVFITRDTGFAPCASCVGSRPRLATMRLDGTDPRVLTGRWRNLDMPAWSPDGTRIAFRASRPDATAGGNLDIYVIGSDGSGLRRLTTSPETDSYPSWSPDGSRIIYDNEGRMSLDGMDLSDTQEVWSVPASGGQPMQVTHDDAPEKQAVYSPDGTQIAVSRGPDGLWILDANGTDPRRVVLLLDAPFSPRWSPDGSQIAFLTYENDFRPRVMDPRTGGVGRRVSLPLMRVHILDLSTGEITSLPISTASDVNAVSWLPDGSGFLLDRFVAA